MQKVKISKRVGRQLYRSSPTILTVVASVGVVTTTIMAVRATPKLSLIHISEPTRPY